MSAFRSKMTMRCVVQRNTAATDSWGQPGAPGWTDHLTDQPCYAAVISYRGKELVGGHNRAEIGVETVVLTDLHVYLPVGADVTEKDRIVSVTDRQGVELFAGPMDIKSVDPRPHQFLDLTVRAAA